MMGSSYRVLLQKVLLLFGKKKEREQREKYFFFCRRPSEPKDKYTVVTFFLLWVDDKYQ